MTGYTSETLGLIRQHVCFTYHLHGRSLPKKKQKQTFCISKSVYILERPKLLVLGLLFLTQLMNLLLSSPLIEDADADADTGYCHCYAAV